MVNSIRRISLTQWIIISMIVGVLLGWLAPGFAVALKPLSTIFLQHDQVADRAAALRHARGGDRGPRRRHEEGRKLAFRSIVYFEIVTTLALVVGLIAVNLVEAGRRRRARRPRRCRRPSPSSSQRHVDVLGRARAHRAVELRRRRREERSAAGRLLVDHLRRRARAHAESDQEDHARFLREPVAR